MKLPLGIIVNKMKRIARIIAVLGLIALVLYGYNATYWNIQFRAFDQALATYQAPTEFRFLLRQRLGDPCFGGRWAEGNLCNEPSEELVYATSLSEEQACPILHKSMESWPAFANTPVEREPDSNCLYYKGKGVGLIFDLEVRKKWIGFTPPGYEKPLEMINATDKNLVFISVVW
jgi:hypothetical protein